MKPHLIFRIHCDLRLGMGHVSRAVALAASWKAMGGTATIAISGDNRAKQIAAGRNPFSESELPCSTAYVGSSIEAPLPDGLKSLGTVVLVDLWDASQELINALRPLKIAMMEDDTDIHESVDLLFQPYLEGFRWGNAPVRTENGKKMHPYEEQRNGCRVLKGASYIVLSERTTQLHVSRKQIQPLSVKKLLVTFGGTDGSGLASRAHEILTKVIDESSWDGHCTLLAPSKINVRETPGITVIPGLQDLSLRLPEFDAIWCSGGITLAECLYLGIPIAAWSQNERQHRILADIAMEGACINLGLGSEANPETVKEALGHWLGPLGQESRQEQSSTGMTLVDGTGTAKILLELWNLAKQ